MICKQPQGYQTTKGHRSISHKKWLNSQPKNVSKVIILQEKNVHTSYLVIFMLQQILLLKFPVYIFYHPNVMPTQRTEVSCIVKRRQTTLLTKAVSPVIKRAFPFERLFNFTYENLSSFFPSLLLPTEVPTALCFSMDTSQNYSNLSSLPHTPRQISQRYAR